MKKKETVLRVDKQTWQARCRYCGRISALQTFRNARGAREVVDPVCPHCAQPGPWDLVERQESESMSADIPPAEPPSADPAGGPAPARTGAAQLVARLTGRTKPGPRS